MNRRLTCIAIGICCLLGCTNPEKQSPPNASTPAFDNDLGLDEALGERAEPDEANTRQSTDSTLHTDIRLAERGEHVAQELRARGKI